MSSTRVVRPGACAMSGALPRGLPADSPCGSGAKPVARGGTPFAAPVRGGPVRGRLGPRLGQQLEDRDRPATTVSAAPAAVACAPGSQLLVGLATIYALPFVGLMMFAPQWEKTKQIVSSQLLFLPLAFAYFYLLVMSWQPDTLQLVLPGDIKEGLTGLNPQFFPKLESISTLFSRLTTAASVWLHLVTINLFLAKLTYFRGLSSKVPSFHSIFLAAFFGPLAILSIKVTEMLFKKPSSTEGGPDAAVSPSKLGEPSKLSHQGDVTVTPGTQEMAVQNGSNVASNGTNGNGNGGYVEGKNDMEMDVSDVSPPSRNPVSKQSASKVKHDSMVDKGGKPMVPAPLGDAVVIESDGGRIILEPYFV